MLFNLQCFASGSEDGSELIKADWFTDYTNANDVVLTVEVESSAGYVQTIAVVMYDDGFDALSADKKPAITDYFCMDEIVVKKGENGRISFDITDTATPLADGAYKILVQGSGADAAKSRLQIPVWVINPSKIPGLISRFNSADAANLKGYIDEVKLPLRLEVSETESSDRIKAFLSIRAKDYKDKFVTLHDVEKAWHVSEIIACLSDASPDKEYIRTLVETNAESIGIDTENVDYAANIDDVYKTMVYNNSIDAVSSMQEIKTLFEQAVAIEALNSASGTEISSVLAVYYEDIGISEKDYEKFADCTDSQTKLKIARMLANKDFKTVDEINSSFKGAIDKYIKDDSLEDTGSSGSTGGGGGGGGGGKAGSAIKGAGGTVSSAVTAPAYPQTTQPSFADCPESHWAYSYIEELKKSNIISGYSDGKFYPDKTVTREEFVKMVMLISGLFNENSTCEFSDAVKGEWYYAYVASAYAEGIINGVNAERFGIGSEISRQDVAVIICRLLTKLDAELKADGEAISFTDSEAISDYAAQSISTLTKMSVLNGFSDGTFRPGASLTRAEAAKILGLAKSHINQ